MIMNDSTGSLHAIFSETNRGLAGTRNFGLQSARYRSMLCMDADNELVPENLFWFYLAARDTKAALVYGNLMCKTDGNVDGLLSNDVVHEGILQQNYIDAMAIVDAEKVVALGGYSKHPDARAHEDWELLLHLIAENAVIVFVPMLLGIYHIVDLSMIKQTAFDHSRIHRMFDQRKVGLPSGFRSRVYHPELGFLI
jgi:glycosyltransferase involved in cell wall biosynthesis